MAAVDIFAEAPHDSPEVRAWMSRTLTVDEIMQLRHEYGIVPRGLGRISISNEEVLSFVGQQIDSEGGSPAEVPGA